jgi:hypothetical protein
LKESKIKLQNPVVLDNHEMKMIYGGSGTGSNACSGLSQSSCVGSCTDSYGVSGSCGWTGAWNACTCATVSIG